MPQRVNPDIESVRLADGTEVRVGDTLEQIGDGLHTTDRTCIVIGFRENGIYHRHTNGQEGWDRLDCFRLIRHREERRTEMRTGDFVIGERVRVKSGRYNISQPGSEGVVTSFEESSNRVKVHFDRVTGHTERPQSDWHWFIDCDDLEKISGEREDKADEIKEEFKTKKQKEEVISYCFPLRKTTINEFLEIGKELKKNVVLVDWTKEHISDIIKPHLKKDLIFFLINPKKKTCEGKKFEFTLDGAKVKGIHDGFQFTKYADEWKLFDRQMFETLSADKGTMYIAEVSKQYVNIFIDLTSFSVSDLKTFMSHFRKKLKEIYPKLEDFAMIEAKKMSGNYQEFIKLGETKLKDSLGRQIKGYKHDIDNHFRAIGRLEDGIYEKDILLRDISKRFSKLKSNLNPDKLKDTFLGFLKEEKIIKIEYDTDKITAYTGKIYLENFGKEFYIGDFRITIKMDGTVRLENLTNKKGDNDHPHIDDGSPCLGSIKHMIPKMIHQADFIGVINLLYEYLTSYHERGAYLKVELGWGTPEDWCGDCDRPSADCHCDEERCSNCGELIDDCGCTRCPDSGEILEEEYGGSYCIECSNWDREEGGCMY